MYNLFTTIAAADPAANALGLKDYFQMNISVLQMLLTFAIAIVVGLFIYFIYKHTFEGIMYSRSLNVSYVLLTLVTALMLMLINNNLTLSLGMVGALSIIRFRTAVKDPIDTMFMFWAVGEGIAIGTKYFLEAIVAAIVIGVCLVVLSLLKNKKGDNYLLIIHYSETGAPAVKALIKQLPKCTVKSKAVEAEGTMEIILDISVKPNEMSFIDKLGRIEGINDAMLVTHNGDVVA